MVVVNCCQTAKFAVTSFETTHASVFMFLPWASLRHTVLPGPLGFRVLSKPSTLIGCGNQLAAILGFSDCTVALCCIATLLLVTHADVGFASPGLSSGLSWHTYVCARCYHELIASMHGGLHCICSSTAAPCSCIMLSCKTLVTKQSVLSQTIPRQKKQVLR